MSELPWEDSQDRIDPTAHAVHMISGIIEHLETVPPRELKANSSGLIEAHLKLGGLLLGALRANT